MKKIKLHLLFLLHIPILFLHGGCHSQQSPLKVVWINTKNTFVNGEPIALSYYVENTSNNVIRICDPAQQARTIKYDMDLSYFDGLMRYRESCKRNNQVFNLDSIKNIAKFAKSLNSTSHWEPSDTVTIFEQAKQPRCSEKNAHTLQPKERKYFQCTIYNHGIGLNYTRYVSNELVAGDYILKIRIANLPQGYIDDSFVFSIYDRSLSQEQEYKELHDIFHQDWVRFNVAKNNPSAIGKTIEDFILQYPNSIFVEKALTLIADNGLRNSGNDFKVLNEKYLKKINNDALLCYISWLASQYVVEYDFRGLPTPKFAERYQMSKFQYFDLMLKNFKNKKPEVSDFLISAIKYHGRFYKKKSSPNLRTGRDPEDYDNLVNYARETENKK